MIKIPKYEIGQKVWALKDNSGVYSTSEVMVHNIHIAAEMISYIVRGTDNPYSKNHSEDTLFLTSDAVQSKIKELEEKTNRITSGVTSENKACRVSYDNSAVIIECDQYPVFGKLYICDLTSKDCIALSKFFEELAKI